MADLTVGKKAPLFTLPSDGGQDISLSDYKGGKVILYFYPKDNTSGCTLEAQAFRANLEEFKKRGYSVLGVSRDSVKKQLDWVKVDGQWKIAAETVLAPPKAPAAPPAPDVNPQEP